MAHDALPPCHTWWLMCFEAGVMGGSGAKVCEWRTRGLPHQHTSHRHKTPFGPRNRRGRPQPTRHCVPAARLRPVDIMSGSTASPTGGPCRRKTQTARTRPWGGRTGCIRPECALVGCAPWWPGVREWGAGAWAGRGGQSRGECRAGRAGTNSNSNSNSAPAQPTQPRHSTCKLTLPCPPPPHPVPPTQHIRPHPYGHCLPIPHDGPGLHLGCGVRGAGCMGPCGRTYLD
jgi:hypothetical protein